MLEEFPLPNLQFPRNGCQIMCSKYFFFSWDNELQVYHGNFHFMDNKRRKSFVIKQSEGCRFVSKMHQNRFYDYSAWPTSNGDRTDCVCVCVCVSGDRAV